MSTRLTENLGLDAVAITVMRYRSSAGETGRSRVCHGSPVGTKATSRSPNRWATSLAATRWPWWMGSKVPPITPIHRDQVAVVDGVEGAAHHPDSAPRARSGP